jgi:hypothetical protein
MLTSKRCISGFVAFLLVDIKSFSQSFRVQLVNLGSSYLIYSVWNFLILTLITSLVTLNRADQVISLPRGDLAITKVIVVYSNVEVTLVRTAYVRLLLSYTVLE